MLLEETLLLIERNPGVEKDVRIMRAYNGSAYKAQVDPQPDQAGVSGISATTRCAPCLPAAP